MAQYPCRNCIYFNTCGDNMRTAECKGRTTKTDKKQADKKTGARLTKDR